MAANAHPPSWPAGSGPLVHAGAVVDGHYIVGDKLGSGGFAMVYDVIDLDEKKSDTPEKLAIKVEPLGNSPALQMDVCVLREVSNRSQFCRLHGAGRYQNLEYMVMTKLGRTVSSLKKSQPTGNLSVSTTIRIGYQVVKGLSVLHRKGFVHRDIKPHNLAMGLGEKRRKCIIFDFGLARRIIDTNGKVKEMRKRGASFQGTYRYGSINSLQDKDISQQDDHWSLLYTMLDLVCNLPWRRFTTKHDVMMSKIGTDIWALVDQHLPYEFQRYVDIISKCEYGKRLREADLRDIFKSAMKRLNIQDSDPFDWEIRREEESCNKWCRETCPDLPSVNRDEERRQMKLAERRHRAMTPALRWQRELDSDSSGDDSEWRTKWFQETCPGLPWLSRDEESSRRKWAERLSKLTPFFLCAGSEENSLTLIKSHRNEDIAGIEDDRTTDGCEARCPASPVMSRDREGDCRERRPGDVVSHLSPEAMRLKSVKRRNKADLIRRLRLSDAHQQRHLPVDEGYRINNMIQENSTGSAWFSSPTLQPRHEDISNELQPSATQSLPRERRTKDALFDIPPFFGPRPPSGSPATGPENAILRHRRQRFVNSSAKDIDCMWEDMFRLPASFQGQLPNLASNTVGTREHLVRILDQIGRSQPFAEPAPDKSLLNPPK